MNAYEDGIPNRRLTLTEKQPHTGTRPHGNDALVDQQRGTHSAAVGVACRQDQSSRWQGVDNSKNHDSDYGAKSMRSDSHKKFRILFFTAIIAITVFGTTAAFAGTAAAQESSFVDVDPNDLDGSGTADKPYVITNASELQAMEDDLDASYTLGNDIDASGTANWNNDSGFNPVGNASTFTGTLSGQGYSVTGLTINRSDNDQIGLFGSMSGDVTNISVDDADINGSKRVGVLIGEKTGGSVRKASASGTVSGTRRIGGLMGANGDGTVNKLSATTDVTGRTSDYNRSIGGLVGYSGGTVSNSSASGEVTGGSQVGGLVGYNEGSVSNSSAFGGITGSGVEVGGLVGGNYGTVSNSYATGSVSGSADPIGGLVGNNDERAEVSESYWDTQATGQSSSAGSAKGLTTAEMTGGAARGNMTGLAFHAVWQTQVDEYPALIGVDTIEAPTISPQQDALYNPDTSTTIGTSHNATGVVGVNDVAIRLVNVTDGNGTVVAVNDTVSITDDINTTIPASELSGDVTIEAQLYNNSSETVTAAAPVDLTSSSFVDIAVSDLAGSGTTDDPYVITNASELQAIDDDLTANYTLGNDIDASGTSDWNYGVGFNPIGAETPGDIFSEASGFNGSFDGNGHTISGLTINRPTTVRVGLFGAVESPGEITNITLMNVSVEGKYAVGGLVGSNGYPDSVWTAGGSVTNASVNGTINGTADAGGLVGRNGYDGSITHVSASGTVNSTEDAGGLAGRNDGSITHVSASGTVNSDIGAGGLVGVNRGLIENAFATGAVDGDSAVGGLVGDDDLGTGSTTDSYWDTEATGQDSSAGGATGLTTAQLTGAAAKTNMSGFEFGTIWQARSDGYPALLVLDSEAPTIASTAKSGYNPTRPTTIETTHNATGVIDTSDVAIRILNATNGNGTVVAVNSTVPLDGDATTTIPADELSGDVTIEVQLYNTSAETVTAATQTDLINSSFIDFSASDLAGSGTTDDPFEITNASELQAMEDDLTANYTLKSDIDATTTSNWNFGRGFDPVGSTPLGFNGSFDGNEHTISGLTIDRSNKNVMGLFGKVGSQGEITNIMLKNSTIKGSRVVGSLAGGNDGSITNAVVNATTNGSSGVGGLVGVNSGSITNVSTEGIINGNKEVGGLVGLNQGDRVTRDGSVLERGSIANSSADGTVNGDSEVGGLVGVNQGGISLPTIRRSGSDIEGGSITDTFATGVVDGDSSIGGLVGSNDGSINDSYWDTEATGQLDSAGNATDLTTAEMTGEAAQTNMNLSFGTVWQTQSDGYPTLVALPSDDSEADDNTDDEDDDTEDDNTDDEDDDTEDDDTEDDDTEDDDIDTTGSTGGAIGGGGGGGGQPTNEEEQPASTAPTVDEVRDELEDIEPTTETSTEITTDGSEGDGITVSADETEAVDEIAFESEDVSGSVEVTEYEEPPESVTESISAAVSESASDDAAEDIEDEVSDDGIEETDGETTTDDDGGDGEQSTESDRTTSVTVATVADISPTADSAESSPATVTMTVDRDELDADPSDAFIVHEQGDSWERLETSVDDTSEEEVTLEAQADSFSLFAVAEVQQESPSESDTQSAADSDQGNSDDGADTDASPSVLLLVGVLAVAAVAGAAIYARSN